MAESRLDDGDLPGRRRPRLRAGRQLRERHNLVGFHGHGLLALIFLAIVCLSILGVGLGVASVTIFSVGGKGGPSSKPAVITHVSPSPSSSNAAALVGHAFAGTIVGLWTDQNLVAIEPAVGQPVQAVVTKKSTLTRGGSPCSIDDLIPGDAIVVTLGRGAHGTLVVVNLQDIETVPTNTPSPTPTPFPTYTPEPSAPPAPGPSGPGPLPSPGGPGGP
ncbi:MAG: hypothetical protein ACREN7_08250 [Candidatus Dormibacteria bacterium]